MASSKVSKLNLLAATVTDWVWSCIISSLFPFKQAIKNTMWAAYNRKFKARVIIEQYRRENGYYNR